jgi:hypothetical protein
LATDFYIMCIPLPMVWSARISVTKKSGLFVMFSGGMITAVFGGLRCGYVLQDNVQGPALAGQWSCRESFVAVFISNFPILFPFLLRSIRSRFGSSGQSNDALTPAGGNTKASGRYKLSSMPGGNKTKKFKHPLSIPGDTVYDRFGSEEEIMDAKDGANKKIGPIEEEDPDIKVTTEWHVQSQQVDDEALTREKRERVTAGYHAR